MKICDSAFLDNGFNIFKGESMFKRIYFRQYVEDSQLINEIEIFINKDWGYELKVLGRNINLDDFFCDLPRKLTDENVQKFAVKLRNINACQGLEKSEDILEDKINFVQPFVNEKGEGVAYVENERGTQFDFHSFRRIRHISCQGLISDDVTICDTCKNYENTLRKTRSRRSDEPERKKMPVSDTSKVNYRYLKKEELIERLSNTQKEKSKPIETTMKMSILISTCIKMKVLRWIHHNMKHFPES